MDGEQRNILILRAEFSNLGTSKNLWQNAA